ncbi:STAS domain-containing protein [Acaryochloris sp. CCMEE 5410]|uniref:STAS domain-containing protein n=1 Tax=Acaryochloris sp. CCMEE 5410 TaxID=310037 RepID=UPI000248457F|nr:STAS domain-containing protein [Acaryochloris sp. CCMEE 5410]KAI9133130.1 STAS domain-containing protein [Acaryochloris sp. CCMEE 5410]
MSYKIIQPLSLTDGIGLNQVRNEIDTVLNEGVKTILLDLQDVTFINSSAIGALVAMHKAVHGRSGKLSICSMRKQVSLVLKLSRMDQIFDIFTDKEEFQQKNEAPIIS